MRQHDRVQLKKERRLDQRVPTGVVIDLLPNGRVAVYWSRGGVQVLPSKALELVDPEPEYDLPDFYYPRRRA